MATTKLQTLVRLAEFENLTVLPNTIERFDVMDTGSARCFVLSWLPTDLGELVIVQRDANSDKFFAVTLPCNGTHTPHSYTLPKLTELTHIEILANCPTRILALEMATWEAQVSDALTYAGLQAQGSDLFNVVPSPEGNTAFLHCGRHASVSLGIPRVLSRGSFYSFLLRTRAPATMLLPGTLRATISGSILGKWPTPSFTTSVSRVGHYSVPFELMLAENNSTPDFSSGVAFAAQRRVVDL